MVDRVESRRLLIPATFGLGNLTFTPLNFRPGIVRSVAIVVPPGVRAAIGVGLGYSGVVVIPNTDGELIYTDGEVVTWPVDGLPVGVQWQLVTDPQASTDHFITVRMAVDEIAGAASLNPPPSPAEAVMALAPPDLSVDTSLPPDDGSLDLVEAP